VIDLSWQLPERYQRLDLTAYVVEQFERRQAELAYSPVLHEQALVRLAAGLEGIEGGGLGAPMRTLVYVVDELRAHNVTWGVGRGSSCASYVLFLIGLHVVDCVALDVPAEEFFHDD